MNYSKQRDMIENFVRYSKLHPTAEDIHDKVSQKLPNISLGTVYRNLDNLVKEGTVLRIKMDDGKYRFDGNTKHHYHGICQKCGRVIDIFMDYMSDIDETVKIETNINVISHTLVFNTICQDCK